MIKLLLNEIQDFYTRENFKRIRDASASDVFGRGKFKFFEIAVSGAVTNQKYPHNLGFAPKDLILTSQIGTGSLTVHYESFDREAIYFTTTGPVTFRAFIGRYEENSDA